MPRISHGLSDRFCKRSELRETSLQPGSVLPTPAVSCNCRCGSGVPAQGLEAWISQLSQVNSHLHDLGVCKWRRLREGAQPGKAEVRALRIAARKKEPALRRRRRSATHSWRRRGAMGRAHHDICSLLTPIQGTLPTWPPICKAP